MAWQKGQSGNRNGRPKGAKDKLSAEVRSLARNIFDKAYWERVSHDAKAGTLNPKIEALLLNYAYGLPAHDHAGQSGVVVSLGFIAAPEARPAVLIETGLTRAITDHATDPNMSPNMTIEAEAVHVPRDDDDER